jgi:hypothetical protein
MKKIILSIAIIFVFAALIPNIQQEGTVNSLYAYFLYVVNFIVQNYFIFILGFIVLIGVFIQSANFDKSHSLKENFFLSVFQIINAFIIGIFLSYVILLAIAFIELNALSISININKNIMGIVTDKNTIVSMLKRNSHPPQIVAGDKGKNKELVAIASTITGTDNVYGKYIISSIPSFFILPIKKFDSSVLLVDDTLIITQLNAHDIEKISPTISYLLVQQYFFQRKIRSYPQVSIMGKKEYQQYREADFKNNLEKINKEIKKYEKLKASTRLSLEEEKDKLLYYKDIVDKSNLLKESEYKRCLSDGNYSLSYCKNLLEEWEDLKLEKEQIDDLNKKILSDQNKLEEYEEYYEFYTALEKSVAILKGNVPHELGTFMPKNSIKIALNTTNPHATADYFETLVHEFLHYASYISEDKKFSDGFFEEGLTEYFARQIIKDDLNISTNLGYPIIVKIIDQMTKRILESELAEIYFSKDQDRLEKILDQVYGENFYKNSRFLFLTLQYTSDKKQTLQVANDIMKKIGGSPLKEKDLFASSSE